MIGTCRTFIEKIILETVYTVIYYGNKKGVYPGAYSLTATASFFVTVR
jgi:hypothetical protein